MNIKGIKNDFPIFREHPGLVYLDSAATSQKPKAVIDAVANHYRTRNANIHRGIYKISEEATAAYDAARDAVAKFINAPSSRNIIFVRNATEGINLVAHAFARSRLKKGDVILATLMEHHANIVPWHMLAKDRGIKVAFTNVTLEGYLDEEDFKKKLTSNVKLAACTHASNVLGTINPVKRLVAYANKKGIPVLVDGAQAAPHLPVDVHDMGCDFYVLSGHKMLAPSGIGALYMSDEMIDALPPFMGGGDMIEAVTTEGFTYQPAPLKFEAGTPAIEAAIGFGEAIVYLQKIGMKAIRKHEIELTKYALHQMRKIRGVTVYGPKKAEDRTGAIAFSVDGIHPHDLASLFDAENICVRAGNHCTMPLHENVLGVNATTRMSFYIYNDMQDIDKAIRVLNNIIRTLK
ncbi:MAG: SufS family cysteine desulfurase [bacterium]|nr:SufS family cysteine desulfurase [bacterium]